MQPCFLRNARCWLVFACVGSPFPHAQLARLTPAHATTPASLRARRAANSRCLWVPLSAPATAMQRGRPASLFAAPAKHRRKGKKTQPNTAAPVTCVQLVRVRASHCEARSKAPAAASIVSCVCALPRRAEFCGRCLCAFCVVCFVLCAHARTHLIAQFSDSKQTQLFAVFNTL